MIEITFMQFYKQQYEDHLFCLYVMKNGNDEVLYVGISTNNVWERWFSWGGHMLWDGMVIYGVSPVGEKIEDHLPDSLQWKIQLWTLQDCVNYCKDQLPADASMMTIRDIEPYMIHKLSPALNGIHNLKPGNDTTPKSRRENERQNYENQSYNEIFNSE